MTRTRRALLAAVAASSLTAANLEAVVPHKSPLAEKSFQHPGVRIPVEYVSLPNLQTESLRERVGTEIAALGVTSDTALFDPRAGRLASLIVSVPLIPGTGDGNALRWNDLAGAPADESALKEAVWTAVLGYLQQHAAVLRVDPSELSAPRIAVHEGGNIIQVYSQRSLNGFPVRDSSLTAIINHGNLVLFGLQNWGDGNIAPAAAQVSLEQARLTMSDHVQPDFITGYAKDARLEYIPMAVGSGFEFRLVWAIRATVKDDLGTWEALVDANSGELLAFEDRNQYVARQVMGGVYPVSNDQVPPDGVEQPGFPMPFANVTTPAGVVTANSAGTIGCATGTISTALVGQYARINDTCGVINETAATGNIDLGFGPTPTATDCTVPAGHSAGDTKSSRSAFYELTRINELARAHLPTNSWLQTSLLANVNILQTCNANWNGVSVQFFRDSGSQCRNTGEIAAIFDHEWGHGMDNNGVNPNIANPGEGIADVYSILRLNDSCMGRGFFKSGACGGYGDPCTVCTGVRDTDWARRASGVPHGIPWIDANCGGGPAPCGGGVHCEGAVVGESGWDLSHRDFRGFGGSVFNYDHHTALELSTRLFYIGSGPVVSWFTCTNPNGGCVATGGYMNVLAVDDDNGNLTDGTPHMTAIHAAFNRHNIACATPAPVNSGCAGGPTTASVVTAVPQDQGVALSWTAVPGAARYYVYRTEGNGLNFGKVRIAEVTGTTYVDTNLQNGRQYFFAVLPVGSNLSCFGLMSTPVSVVPVVGPNVAVRPTTTYTVSGGDGDGFLDNCETATVNFTVENTGTGALTNVRLVAVTFITHPASVLQTTLPAPIATTLLDCASAPGSFAFTLNGATAGQMSQIRIEVTADELAGQTRSQTITIGPVEQDTVNVATRTYTFDTNLDGWTILSGTWTRQTPGASGTTHHLSSTEATPDNCDAIRSPAIRIKANSTLALHNRYQIEPTDPTGGPYDRANVGLRDVVTNVRTVVVPNGGHLYTLPPGSINGTCEQTNQAGWNGNSPGFPAFNQSTWTSAAFNPGGAFTDRLAYIEIRYGTDPLLHPSGFDYDQVTVTNFDDVVPDTLPNTCIAQAAAPVALAVDTAGNSVMEPNELVVMAPTWRNVGSAAIALNGATSAFTGPAGGTYTNPDAAASYGTIPVAGQSSCSSTGNCYGVQADAATRPVTHWDSTILETVTPSAATKTWTLHIGASFTDVTTASPFYRFVETIIHKNVTGGCTLTTYCPDSPTTREQMAVFVLVSKEPVGYAPPPCGATPAFTDVPVTSPFCRWIEELARRGVTGGCTATTYCPGASVTREQMAVFVLRTLDPALNPPACTTPVFADVPASSPFCRWIEELARRAVVTGCGGGNYCPASNVTREQMSVFLAVTFGLTLYGL